MSPIVDAAAVTPLARLAAQAIDPTGESMVLLTGSIARRLADEASDVDIYLYGDVAPMSSPPDLSGIGAPVFAVPTPTGWFVKLVVDGRHCDVEAVDRAVLERAASALAAGAAPPDWAVKIAVGLRDAIAVDGSDVLAGWQQRLRDRDDTAAAEVAARTGRLVAPSALYALTWARGDVVAFAARLSRLLLDVVALLGAVNRRFVPVDDPKWLPWHVARLEVTPAEIGARIDRAVRDPTPATMSDLDLLVTETLDLVDLHVPGADTTRARFTLALRPRPPARR